MIRKDNISPDPKATLKRRMMIPITIMIQINTLITIIDTSSPPVEPVVRPKFAEFDGIVFLHDDGAQKRGYDKEDKNEAQQASFHPRNTSHYQRIRIGEEQRYEKQAYHQIKGDGYQHGPDELVPGALMSCGHCSRRIMRQVIFQELWQVPVCKNSRRDPTVLSYKE